MDWAESSASSPHLPAIAPPVLSRGPEIAGGVDEIVESEQKAEEGEKSDGHQNVGSHHKFAL